MAQTNLSLARCAWSLLLAASWNGCGSPQPEPAQPLRIQLHLRLRDQAAAEAELYALDDPASPRYGQFLSAADFRARYAPGEGDVAEVRRWLADQGLAVESVADNQLLVQARGTAVQVKAALEILPDRLPSTVLSVTGLGQTTLIPAARQRLTPVNRAAAISPAATDPPVPPPPGTRDGQPCSLWWNQVQDRANLAYGGGFPDPTPYLTCGYTPPRLRSAYGLDTAVRAGNDGSGVTIAVAAAFAASPHLFRDAQTYSAQNDPDHVLDAEHFTSILVPGADPMPPPDPALVQGWWQDQTSSVEALHAMAPGARIVYVGARSPSDSDQIAALNYAIDHDLASIISAPWTAGPESGVTKAPEQIKVYKLSASSPDSDPTGGVNERVCQKL